MEKSLDQLIASSGNSFVDTFIKKTHLVKHLNNDIIKIREATSYPIKKALGQAKKINISRFSMRIKKDGSATYRLFLLAIAIIINISFDINNDNCDKQWENKVFH